MTHIEGQIALRQAHILRCHAEVVSGAYVNRNITEYSQMEGDHIQISDEDKLIEAMETMDRHIKLFDELIENLHKFNKNNKSEQTVTYIDNLVDSVLLSCKGKDLK